MPSGVTSDSWHESTSSSDLVESHQTDSTKLSLVTDTYKENNSEQTESYDYKTSMINNSDNTETQIESTDSLKASSDMINLEIDINAQSNGNHAKLISEKKTENSSSQTSFKYGLFLLSIFAVALF